MKAFRFGLCVLVFIVPLAGCSRALSGDVDSRAVTPSSPPAKPVERPSLIGVSFIDAANGWGITMDSLWKTSDRGETWTKVFTFAETKAAGIPLPPIVSQVEALPDG